MADLKRTCAAAIIKYGTTSQMNMAQEECAEFIAAVNQLRRGRITIDELADELADVIITSEGARQIINELGGDVEEKVAAKLERLEKRIG